MLKTFLFLIAFLITVPASQAAEFGRWHSDRAHGYDRYWTVNTTGARFTIWCPPNHNPRGVLISVDIKGKPPTPDTLVRIELDHKLVKFRAGSDGYIRNDCPACADNLTYFWHRLRTSFRFKVQLEDRRYAGFSLRGVREAMPHSVCASQVAQNSQ